MTLNPATLAAALAAARKGKALTQAEVARRMERHVSYIQALEYKPDNRKINSYLDYAEAIGVKVNFTLE